MDVCVLRWPDQADEADRLASAGTPRLLVVEPGAAPPVETSCVADWIRLPADDIDMRTRLATLAARAARHRPAPVVDEYGGVSYGGKTVFLTVSDERIASVLVEFFGHPVLYKELTSRVWTGDASKEGLRVQVSRLRRRIAPLGLSIKSIRGCSYAMCETEVNGQQ
jgi:DNA-binding response OmpR family regulator